MKAKPDTDTIREIILQAEQMHRASSLEYSSWRNFVEQVDQAAHGDEQWSEALFRFAKTEWIQRILAEPKPKKPGRARTPRLLSRKKSTALKKARRVTA